VAEVTALLQHASQEVVPTRLAEPNVDEARARDLGTLDPVGRGAQLGRKPLGDRARGLPQALGENQRRVAREIAVVGAARDLEGEVGRLAGVTALVEQHAHGAAKAFAESLSHCGAESPFIAISSRNSGICGCSRGQAYDHFAGAGELEILADRPLESGRVALQSLRISIQRRDLDLERGGALLGCAQFHAQP
jgi:hypothetical protein